MLNKGKGRKYGLTVVELLVVLAASAIIATVGMKLVHLCLARMSASVAGEMEEQAIWDVHDRLQMAWDQRLKPSEAGEPWLETDVTGTGPAYALGRIRIRCAGTGGEVRFLELASEGGQWLLRSWPEAASPGPPASRPVAYAGAILVDVAGGRFLRNEGPESVRFRFPEAGKGELRQGFAIRSYW